MALPKKKPVLVELLGGPGTGKTMLALLTTGELKASGVDAEYVGEVARELIMSGEFDYLLRRYGSEGLQSNLLWKQRERLRAAINSGPDVVVTDSPLILQKLYQAANSPLQDLTLSDSEITHGMCSHVLTFWPSHSRTEATHVLRGRHQTIAQAEDLDVRLRNLLYEENYSFQELEAGMPEWQVDAIIHAINKTKG